LKFEVNKYLLDNIDNSDHPSSFDNFKDYSILILRLPYIKNDEVDVFSYAFLIKDNEVYKYRRKKKEFEKIGNFIDLYEFLDLRVDKIIAKVSSLQYKIEILEDKLYDKPLDKGFPRTWLLYKKDLSLIERLIGHSIVAFERFLKHYKDSLDEMAYNDLREHMERTHILSKSGMEKLDNLYNFYRAKTDEKMNQIMFVLTIISAIFLPITLVTGFFGMNTGGLPLVDDKNGTIKVTIALILFEIPFVYLIWIMMKKS